MNPFWQRLTAAPHYLDQTDQRLDIDPPEVERFFLPLAQALLELAASRRCLVAVAGPPGVGKSAFAATLALVANALADLEIALVVGLDGWHYPNAYLDDHTCLRGGRRVPLCSVKGAPETFDALAALATLAAIRNNRPDETVTFPIYSRALHEPLANAGKAAPTHKLILFEGNYWLLDQAPWSSASPHFDRSIFLTASPETLLVGLRERQVRGGRTPEVADAHIQAVDLPNMRLVLDHSAPANWTITKADSRRIVSATPPL